MSNITVSTSRNLDDTGAATLAGTISASTASTTVTGVGTTFNATNTPPGAPLYAGTTYLGIVSSVTNTTTLVLTANAAATVSGATGIVHLNLALLNQEIVTITNGATLTVNSDNFYSQQAAYPYYYSVANGTLNFDGTTVWWIPFDASSGNVPGLGTVGTDDVTIGGAAVGEFLEVYSGVATAPLAAGAAMPASGFVKLRRKTGAIADNDVLTFANGATATVNSATGGQRGWLEFHMASNGNFQNLNGIQTTSQGVVNFNGDWFDLGVGSGAAGMTLQHYVGDYCPAVQIETAAGSGVYEWWCAINNTSLDTGHRVFTCSTTGLMTFGGTTWGKIPPSGAKIRVPNICMRSAYNGAAQLTTAVGPRDRPHLSGSAPFTLTRTIFAGNAGRPGFGAIYATYNECAIMEGVSNPETALNIMEQLTMSNCGIGVYANNNFGIYIREASSVNITGCTFYRGNLSGAIYISNSKNITLSDNLCVSQGPSLIQLQYSSAIAAINQSMINGNSSGNALSLVSCSDFVFSGTKISSRTSTVSGRAYSAITLTDCADGVFVGMDYVDGYPYWPQYDFCLMGSNCVRVHFRDIGTKAAPFVALNSGTARAFLLQSGISDVHMARVYVAPGAGYTQTIPSGSGGDFYVSDSGNPLAYTAAAWNTGTYCSGVGRRVIAAAGQPTSSQGIRLPMFVDALTSDTTLSLYLNAGVQKRTDSILEANAYTEDAGGPLIRNNGLVLPTAGQQITWTWSYPILGLTSFVNTAPVLLGANTGNLTVTYDLDKGAGFSGTFKALTAANLSAETGISPTGVRLRVRVMVNTSNASNLLQRIQIYAATSVAACDANPYPLNNPAVTVTGGLSGSIYSIFRATDGQLLAVTSGADSVSMLPPWYEDVAAVLRVRKPGWESVLAAFTLTERLRTIPVSQADSAAIPDSNPGAMSISITNHGASPVTWNSKAWSITVTATGGESAAQIAQWLSWHTAQDSFSLGGGFHNTAWPSMVVAVGTGYETARGTLFGSAGAALKGVRVVDGAGNEIPGFARMQADDGTYYSPAASYTLTVGGIVSGSRLLLRRTDTGAVIANTTVTGTTFTHTYVHTVDIPVEIVVRKATGSPAYQEWRTTTTLAASNNSQTANQLLDE